MLLGRKKVSQYSEYFFQLDEYKPMRSQIVITNDKFYIFYIQPSENHISNNYYNEFSVFELIQNPVIFLFTLVPMDTHESLFSSHFSDKLITSSSCFSKTMVFFSCHSRPILLVSIRFFFFAYVIYIHNLKNIVFCCCRCQFQCTTVYTNIIFQEVFSKLFYFFWPSCTLHQGLPTRS